MRIRRAQPVRARAFTMVELIASMTIIATLSTVASVLIYTSVASYRDAATRAQLVAEASAAMERSVRALRSIDKDTSVATPAPMISSVTPTSITFDTNWTLSLSGSQLLLSEAGATAYPILNNVSAFSISTYNQSNVALAGTLSGAATQPIRRIQLQLTLTRYGQSETLRTRVFVRCTMNGT